MRVRRHHAQPLKRAGVALLVLSPLALVAQQPRDAAPRGAIVNGRVLDTAGQPVSGAQVTLGTWSSWKATKTTGDDGRFEFAGVPAGRFPLTAARQGYFTTAFGALDRSSRGTRLVIKGDESHSEFTLTLARMATVSGTLLRPDGTAAAGVSMTLAHTAGGLTGDGGTTDSEGRFRITGVPPGTYRIVAPYFSRSLGLARGRYAPVYHPGTIDPAEATLVRLEPEEDRDVGTFPLVVAEGATFGGVVLREDATPAAGARIVMGDRSGLERPPLEHAPDAEGRFRFVNVPPGRYTLWASLEGEVPGQLNGVAHLEVDAGRTDESDLKVRLGRPGRFAGRVQLSGTQAPPDAESVRVFVARSGYIPSEVDVRKDGTFAHDFFPGPHQVSAHALGARGTLWRLRSATWNDVDVFERGLDFTAGSMDYSDVVLTLADAGASLGGVVRTAAGAPTADTWIIVFPADRAAWHEESSRIVTARPDTDGLYGVTDLVPGDYLVTLSDQLDATGGRSVAFLDPLVAGSTAVTLREGQLTTLDLRLAARYRTLGDASLLRVR